MASAFAPGNISCVFKIIPHADATRMHSLGMGFTVSEGVTVSVTRHDTSRVLFNGEIIDFPTVQAVVHKLVGWVEHRETQQAMSESQLEVETSETSDEISVALSPALQGHIPLQFQTTAGTPGAEPYEKPMGRAGRDNARFPLQFKVEITSPLPLGCGFGLSGAAALATAYALNELLRLGKASETLAMIAHVAEVENRTGLGDVCSQYHGGCLVKLKEGAPLVADRLPIAEQPIYYRYFGPIQTSAVLGNAEQTARINRAADSALAVLQTLVKATTGLKHGDPASLQQEMFTDCLAVAKQFSVESGLLSDARVIKTIAQIEAAGGVASMIMLGNGVFSTHAFDGAIETQLCQNPARMLFRQFASVR